MSRKIRKVTLLKDIGLPVKFIAKAGTAGVVKVKNAAYWRFYNGDDYYSYSENDIKKFPEYFKIEYETPKIKSVAVKLEERSLGMYRHPASFFHTEYILNHPEKFIIEYEGDSE